MDQVLSLNGPEEMGHLKETLISIHLFSLFFWQLKNWGFSTKPKRRWRLHGELKENTNLSYFAHKI